MGETAPPCVRRTALAPSWPSVGPRTIAEALTQYSHQCGWSTYKPHPTFETAAQRAGATTPTAGEDAAAFRTALGTETPMCPPCWRHPFWRWCRHPCGSTPLAAPADCRRVAGCAADLYKIQTHLSENAVVSIAAPQALASCALSYTSRTRIASDIVGICGSR
ncbi:hypothetical protein MRX96_050125 [Rhipicephalus microplus]